MQEISFEVFRSKAETYSNTDIAWHFHLLSPTCVFNTHAGHFALILENETNGEQFYTLFDNNPLVESKKLAELSYGKGFLETKTQTEADNPASNSEFEALLARAKACIHADIPWHNHDISPNCIFNSLPGKHCIVFEDDESKTPITAVYSHKPMADLVRIEALLYRDID